MYNVLPIVRSIWQGGILTLHSDGTTKFGEHYCSFQISTPTTSYSIGLAEMPTGSTLHVLEILQQVLI